MHELRLPGHHTVTQGDSDPFFIEINPSVTARVKISQTVDILTCKSRTLSNLETPSQPQQFFSELPHGATASFTSSSEDTMESYRNHVKPYM